MFGKGRQYPHASELSLEDYFRRNCFDIANHI
jgi:hypothetical protein